MANLGTPVAAFASLLLAACGHVRGNLPQSASPADAQDEEVVAKVIWVSETTEPAAAEPAGEPPASPGSACASGYVGEGVAYGIAAPVKICAAGGPFTFALCIGAIAVFPGPAIGALVGSMVIGGLVGSAVGAAKCPAPTPAAEPPPAAPAPAPDPEPDPNGGSPGVSWLQGLAEACG